MIKKNRGITVITLSIAVIIILIVTGMLVYSAKDSIYVKNLTNMQNDISNLRDKISLYYSQYGALPARTPYTNTSMLSRFPLGANDDLNGFLIIDLKALDGLTLNYGKDYEKYKENNSIDQSELMDIYVINQKSHNIFYVQGVGVNENGTTKMYYTDYAEGDKEAVEKVKVTIAGRYYKDETDIMVGENQVTIPAGAQVSGIEGEYESVDDGLVVYFPNSEEEKITDWSDTETIQKTYDQFVWVSVENAVLDLSNNSTALVDDASIKAEVQKEIDAGRYPMAIKKDENTYIGVLYQFSEETIEQNGETKKQVKIEPLSDWEPTSTDSGIREPDIAIDYDNDEEYLTQLKEILGTQYISATEFKNDLQVDFKNMVTRVGENGGFWVGRYETSKMNADKISIIEGTQDGVNNVDWYSMYAKQKKYSRQKSLGAMQSSMIWGSQWDQIMIWMKEEENEKKNSYYVTNSLGMGNYGTGDDTQSGLANTGFFEVKNVFDLAGNVREWTLEAYDTNYRALRRRSL